MEKEFVPYELALRMKQLGFDEPCLNFYQVVGRFYASCVYVESQEDIKELCNNGKQVLAPTWYTAFRWFRDNHGLYNQIDTQYEKGKTTGFWVLLHDAYEDTCYDDLSNLPYPTYEEAELACLKKLIEIAEEKLTNSK